jgi:hypothetical protein
MSETKETLKETEGIAENQITKKETSIKETEQQAGETKEKLPHAFKEFHPVNPPFGHVGIQSIRGVGSIVGQKTVTQEAP